MLARLAAATVAGGIAFFILGFVIYGLILDPLVMKPNMNPEAARLMKDPPAWIALVLANLVYAFLFAYIFDKWASIRTFGGGLVAGAILSFLMTVYFQLLFAAFMNISSGLVPVVADVIGATVMGAIGGGVIGAVLGMMGQRTGTAEI